ncbi:unnamed protein product [Urochloa humidicola]
MLFASAAALPELAPPVRTQPRPLCPCATATSPSMRRRGPPPPQPTPPRPLHSRRRGPVTSPRPRPRRCRPSATGSRFLRPRRGASWGLGPCGGDEVEGSRFFQLLPSLPAPLSAKKGNSNAGAVSPPPVW